MWKTIELALKDFNPIPATLRRGDDPGKPVPIVEVDLAKLYHHYYLDQWGIAPPDPDPTRFEHIQFLAPGSDFRFLPPGLGTGSTGKGNKSNELGQAFCRWFLHDHVGITYFAHFNRVCGHGALRNHGGISISRKSDGLTPDYFCSANPTDVFLAEAKGDAQAISFDTQKFRQWRKQFDCVEVLDSSGSPLAVKGFIVATRWAFDHQKKVNARLNAEDPSTPGERGLEDLAPVLSAAVRSIHYSGIAAKLGLAPLSAVLETGVPLPNEIGFQLVVWEILIPPLQGKRFVGGYFPAGEARLPYDLDGQKLIIRAGDPFRLDVAGGTFFGVEEGVFESVVNGARRGPMGLTDLPLLRDVPFAYSGLSILSDGSALGPAQLFRPVEARLF